MAPNSRNACGRSALGIAGALALSWPMAALAEVMDKEPAPSELWAWTGMFVALAFMLACWKTWRALIVWPFSAFYAVVTLSELLDPAVGPAILAEAGWGYAIQGWATVVINAVGPPAIFLWCRRRHRT